MANDWNKFLNKVKQTRAQLGNPAVVWYRGHSDFTWGLNPSLARIPNGPVKEQDAFTQFKRASSHVSLKGESDWEILFNMQHYGIPTRLLDWTSVLGIAVAFAIVDDPQNTHNSAIYILDPLALNKLSKRDKIINITPGEDFDYKKIYWHNIPFPASLPIAIDPITQNDRQFAQKGKFTIHGDSQPSLETIHPNVVKKLILPASAKAEAREFIEYASLNDFSIYPDIVGMSRYIRTTVFGI